MLYFQKPIIEKIPPNNFTDYDLKKLTLKYLKLCKQTREKVSEDSNGVFVINNLSGLKHDIIVQQQKLPTLINSKNSPGIISIKPSLYNFFMNYTGILGYYNPFTAECQYNPNLPSTQIPFTLAHEMSHQLGYAREQEASFIAYLCSRQSENIDLKYSAQLYVMKSLLMALYKNNEAFAKKIISNYSAGMKRDRMKEILFVKNNEGTMSAIFNTTNDLFLKSNQQDGAITYSYFINLLVDYET